MSEEKEGQLVFFCEECNEETNTPNVLCCKKPMKKKPLDTCTKSPACAEHARFDDKDEPCDEGRSG